METTEELRNKIRTAEDLQSVIRTMKGMAAVSIRQYERAVESLAAYSETVELGFQALAQARPGAVGREDGDAAPVTLAIVFGSDQGMCGPFSREIVEHAQEHLDALAVPPTGRLITAMGTRAAAELEGLGLHVHHVFGLPSSVTGLTQAANDLLLHVAEARAAHAVRRVILFHHTPLPGARHEPGSVQLLPLDLDWLHSLAKRPWPTRSLPLITMPWNQLFAALVEQGLYVALVRGLAESLASENASRLAAMQAAEKNIRERIDQLHLRFHRHRQTLITEELLDVVAGFEVLEKVS
jgi:F-type H+-transporting ATPase subunit gamma